MGKDLRVQIELFRMRQSVSCDPLQFVQADKIVLNEKDHVIKIGIEAAIQFA